MLYKDQQNMLIQELVLLGKNGGDHDITPFKPHFVPLIYFLCSSCVFIKDRQRFVSFHRLRVRDRIEPASTIPACL